MVTRPSHVSLSKGQLKLTPKAFSEDASPQDELITLPLDELGAVILDDAQTTVSVSVLSALAKAGVSVLTVDEAHIPNGWLLPMVAHHRHTLVLEQQIALSQPTKKRLWQQLIQQKIRNQAKVLEVFNPEEAQHAIARLQTLASKVSSGDKENLEAQAARLYFQNLPLQGFKRSGHHGWFNSMLNYTYAIYRSYMAKWVCAYGLHPALGIHHQRDLNAFNLVDDLIEPFRPLADGYALHYMAQLVALEGYESIAERDLHKHDRYHAVLGPNQPCKVASETTTTNLAMERLVVGFAQAVKQQSSLTLADIQPLLATDAF
jgi:CRISPR-associated protein Cas1